MNHISDFEQIVIEIENESALSPLYEHIESNDDQKYSDSKQEYLKILSNNNSHLFHTNRAYFLFLFFHWYIISAVTLFTNKYLISGIETNPTLIGTTQVLVTTILGYCQLKVSIWKRTGEEVTILQKIFRKDDKFESVLFWRNILIIGLLRFFSLVVGLMALSKATVSFIETVKSSTPIFTVITSK
jgi:solute carrier family 35, member E2